MARKRSNGEGSIYRASNGYWYGEFKRQKTRGCRTQREAREELDALKRYADNVIAYCARVSNPANQDNPSIERLIRYCARQGHWSIFEMASLCIEITTTRAISAQIVRHRSFSFQEFSQRYAPVSVIEHNHGRRQDVKNRQNSLDDLPSDTQGWWQAAQATAYANAQAVYQEALDRGIARECARMVLPMASQTRLYMAGTVRSWIHYLDLRTGNGTQEEHRQIAESIKAIFVKALPVTAGAIWGGNE